MSVAFHEVSGLFQGIPARFMGFRRCSIVFHWVSGSFRDVPVAFKGFHGRSRECKGLLIGFICDP